MEAILRSWAYGEARIGGAQTIKPNSVHCCDHQGNGEDGCPSDIKVGCSVRDTALDLPKRGFPYVSPNEGTRQPGGKGSSLRRDR